MDGEKIKIRKGQVGIITAVVIAFLGLMVYYVLISNEKKNNDLYMDEYVYDYGNSFLVSLLRSTTGNHIAGCETVRDLLSTLSSTPKGGRCCDISSMTCKDYVSSVLDDKIKKMINVSKKNMVFYFFVEEQNGNVIYYYNDTTKRFFDGYEGDKTVVKQKIISGNSYGLDAYLYLTIK